MSVKVMIIEDDPVWSLFVESIIEDSQYELIGTANTINKAQAIIEGFKPDIVISDIRIQDSTVFPYLFENANNDFLTIFMSSHLDEEIFNLSTKVSKSTYIVKPFHKFSLLAALDLLISKYPIAQPQEESFITVRGSQQQVKKINFNEIEWIEANGNYCFIHTKSNKKYARKKSLKSLIENLDSRFLRVHKAFLINKQYINRIELSNNIVMVGDNHIPLGRHYRKELNQFLEQR
ncbi:MULTISPECIES: LytTR family DNA-binding domain-containing protein [Emticicia]|uniref:LytR/AlgR family response regulator transcription factor n=1 Tax=Emticicia TaxID=312278 RepID=UPI0007D8C962|nr:MULTISPECIES: LytTR family DNA-binding domain-containing protein [Emticicia]